MSGLVWRGSPQTTPPHNLECVDSGWLLIVVAIVGVALGTAIGLVLSASARDRYAAALRTDSVLDARGEVLPVLAALRSTVVVLDDDDEVLRASTAAYTFNIVRDDAVCEPQVAQMVRTVRAEGAVEDSDITVARGRLPGAGYFFLHVRVAPIGRGRILVLIEDRTAAQRLEQMRQDFVANVSHELKTPVGAISLLAETVEASADDPQTVREFAGRMGKESRRLGVLVQEIIELTRLQEGDALASPDDVEVDSVVAEALDAVRVEAEANQVTLVSGGCQGLMVRGDSALITTAVRNLLDNAIRYSGPRTRVSVGVSVDPAHEDLVRIAVVDQGIGIAKEDQDRVFERFYRADKARSRATGGTGLGLSIVKHVAADHGGTVELWSAPGRGSTFTLVLPRLHPAENEPDPEQEAAAAVATGAAGAAFAAIAAISAPPSSSPEPAAEPSAQPGAPQDGTAHPGSEGSPP